jgi:hypothetical protein
MAARKWCEIMEEFRKPFYSSDIEWRVQQSGEAKGSGRAWAMVLAYVDARALRRRLNEIVGLENWSAKFSGVGNGIACTLSIRGVGDDDKVEWIDKSDGAGETDIEAIKGAFSDAFKRACYSWLLGEYLYDLEVNFAEIVEDKNDARYHSFDKKLNRVIHWNPPKMPDWALPLDEKDKTAKASPGHGKVKKNRIVEAAEKYDQFIDDVLKKWVADTNFSNRDEEWTDRNYEKFIEGVVKSVRRKIEDLLLDEKLKPGEARGMITVLQDFEHITEAKLDAAVALYTEGMSRGNQ